MVKTASESSQRVLRQYPATLLTLLFFMLLNLPFINKAFHIDDPGFINLAHMLEWNPLKVLPVNYGHMGKILSNFTPYEASHPLFVPYFIKIITALFGQSEIALHLAFSIFPMIAIWSLIQLNKALFPDSQHAAVRVAIFFSTVPAFFVNAQNIMADVPALSFVLLAMTGFIRGTEKGQRYVTYMGGVALAFALFTSYQAAVCIPLIIFYIVWRRKLSIHEVLSLVLPVMALFSWLIVIYFAYDIFPMLKSKLSGASASINDEVMFGLNANVLIGKIIYVFATLGAASIWIIPFHYFLKKTLGRFFVTLLLLVIGSYLAIWNFTAYPAMANLTLALFIALGLQTIGTMGFLVRDNIRDGRDIQQTVFILAWFLCVVGYNVFLLPFGSARYLLPALPPVFLLVINSPVWNFSARKRLMTLFCVLCGTSVFALGSAYSDYRFAETYRTFAAEVEEIRTVVGNSPTFWYVGEWGMRYYMSRAGARTLSKLSNEPKLGDFVLIPEMSRLWVPSESVIQRLSLLYERSYSSALPLRLFNRRSNAGFYCHLWGMLPFALDTEPDEIIAVYKVVK